MWRNIAAVIVGYLAMAIPIGVTITIHAKLVFGKMPAPGQHFDPPLSFAILTLIYSSLFAIFGGHVCASIAKGDRLKVSLILAGLVVVLSLVSAYIDRAYQPLWYAAALVVLSGPATALGGWIRAKRDSAATATSAG
jgi:hypothetical protein